MSKKIVINGLQSVIAFAFFAFASNRLSDPPRADSNDHIQTVDFVSRQLHSPNLEVLVKNPTRYSELSPDGESLTEIATRISSPQDTESNNSLNLSEWNLSCIETLEVLDELLQEILRQSGGDESMAISWLAAGLMEGGDEKSLLALAGEAICNDDLLSKVLVNLENNDTNQANKFRRVALIQLSSHDPAGGLRWIDEFNRDYTQKSGNLGSPVLSSLTLQYSALVVKKLSEMDTNSAISSLNILLGTESGNSLRSAYLDMRVREDPDELWNAQIASGADQAMICATIDSLAQVSPSDAARRVREANMPEEVTVELERNILDRWINQSPRDVFNSLRTNRSDWKIPSPMKILFAEWASRDTLEATTALGTMLATPDRDDAIQGAISRINTSNPEVAIKWIDQVSDPKIRTELIEQYSKR